MEEKELIQRLQWGEENAFETIFRSHFNRLCFFAEHFVKSHQTAEEIVEDFFCHLWDNCQNLSINKSLKGYLYQSVRNRCLNYIRNQKVRKQHLNDNPYCALDDELFAETIEDNSYVDLITCELEDKIQLEVKALPEQCRAIFCLNRYENLSYSEIAEKLDISINTVKTQMTRALHKLRDGLKEYLVIMSFVLFSCNIPW